MAKLIPLTPSMAEIQQATTNSFIYKQSTKTDKGITYPVYSYLRSETFTLEGETKADEKNAHFLNSLCLKIGPLNLSILKNSVYKALSDQSFGPSYEDLVSASGA